MGLTRLAWQSSTSRPSGCSDEAAPDKPEPRRRGRARLEWFDYLALALFVLGTAAWYSAQSWIAEGAKYYAYTPLMVFCIVALRPLGWLAEAGLCRYWPSASGKCVSPTGWVRLICAIFGALPLLAYALSAAASFAGVKGLELVFIQLLKHSYVVALSGLLLGLAAKRREKC